MSEALGRIQKRARKLACSGKFAGWGAITFELQFEPALKGIFWFHSEFGEDAFQWVHSPAAKEEITAFVMRLGTVLPAAILKLLD